MKIIGSFILDTLNLKTIIKSIDSGMTTLRITAAHSDKIIYTSIIDFLRKNNKQIETLLDLSGKKIRISSKLSKEIEINKGDLVAFMPESNYEINNNLICIPLEITPIMLDNFHAKYIFFKDGIVKFKVIGKNNRIIYTVCEDKITLRKYQGVNIPGIKKNNTHILSEKDKNDILWGFKNNIDIICLSFVERDNEIIELKNFLSKECPNYSPKIWAKVETKKGIKNLSKILKECDGLVLGRGDLTLDVGLFELPKYQEKFINLAKKTNDKDFIIATHVLPTMRFSPMPTISEINEIKEQLNKGINGFLLSKECSCSKNPPLVINTLKECINIYSK